jgi:hypothetical protein
MELSRDSLARHEAALANQQSSIDVESGNRKNDLLGAILQHSLLTLLQEAEQKADRACEQTLQRR